MKHIGIFLSLLAGLTLSLSGIEHPPASRFIPVSDTSRIVKTLSGKPILIGGKLVRSNSSYVAQITPPVTTTTVSQTASLATSILMKVVDTDGDTVGVKTLVSGVKMTLAAAKNYADNWAVNDGTDDFGAEQPNRTYVALITQNKLSYVFKGAIGNSSINAVGYSRHSWVQNIHGCAVGANGYVYFCTKYEEQLPCIHKFNPSTPNIVESVWQDSNETHSNAPAQAICAYGDKVYVGAHIYDKGITCVFAVNQSNGSQVQFSQGIAIDFKNESFYSSVIGTLNGNETTTIRSIAVTEPFIFVARTLSNRIDVLSRTTGATLQTISFTNPRSIVAFGSTLFVGSGSNLTKHTINSDGTISAATQTTSGFSDILSITSLDGSQLLIGDGGTEQRYKLYSSSGSQIWVYGDQGGYANNPRVTYKKFCFNVGYNDPIENDYPIAGGFAMPDGTFFFNDMGNKRMFQTNAARTQVLNEINCQGYSYAVGVDQNNPTRLFDNWLEFNFDPTKSIRDSYKLTYNWFAKVTKTIDNPYKGRLSNVVTFANGLTYCLSSNFYQLDTTFGLRPISINFSPEPGPFFIDRNGSFQFATLANVGSSVTYSRRSVVGYTGTGNNTPLWGPLVAETVTPSLTVKDPVSGGWEGFSFDQRSGNEQLLFDPGITNPYYHLGAVKVTTTNPKWLWHSSPATSIIYQGAMPTDGSYDIGNHPQYGGVRMTSLGRDIFWNYRGEFWRGAETNILNHHSRKGAFLGVFGVTSDTTGVSRTPPGYPGFAGNTFTFKPLRVGNRLFVMHGGEVAQTGISIWEVMNPDSVFETNYVVTKTGSPVPALFNYTDYLSSFSHSVITTVNSGMLGWSRMQPESDNGNDDVWSIKTRLNTYKATDMDITIKMGSNVNNGAYGTTRVAELDLNTINLTTSHIETDIIFSAYERGYNRQKYLDASGKTIVVIERTGDGEHEGINVNGVPIYYGGAYSIPGNEYFQPLSIRWSGSNLIVKYRNLSATVPVSESGANISTLKTLRIEMVLQTQTGHSLTFRNFRRYTN